MDFEFETLGSSVIVTWPDGQTTDYPFIWLRDNCQCPKCFHPSTHERLLFTAAIDPEITPTSVERADDGIRILWSEGEGHESIFTGKWLYHNSIASPIGGTVRESATLWDAASINELPMFDFADCMSDEKVLIRWCAALRSLGVAIVRNMPSHDGAVIEFADHVGYVHDTIYDRLHNVFSDPNAYNLASTSEELKPHTDMPNYFSPPGVQLLHFLANEAEGGETTLVDGYQAAVQLREEDPEAYDILAKTDVGFRLASEKGDIVGQAPLIEVDNRGFIRTIRYSNQLMLPLLIPGAEVKGFYDAYRKFTNLLNTPENLIRFKTQSGDMVAVHNHRVLHGRAEFQPASGARHLQLTYLDFDLVMSRLRQERVREAGEDQVVERFY
ncbi:MAG: TauD/TfdA family dioxygenase [Proteobacteria bacterium]|nr:TauD/TfdA family dioxygenase [Pseudomonadota bacterium]